MGGFLTGVDPGIRKTKTPTVNTFVAGVGFTAGSSTTVALTDAPGTEEHLTIFFDGVGQHRSTYSLSGSTVTFDTAIPTGVAEVEATYAPAVYAQLSTVGDDAVVTAKILDDAVTLAKMAAGTDGNIISYDTSGNPVAVATGSDGQVLTSSGAGAVCAFEDAGGAGLTLATEQATTSGATITFSSIPADTSLIIMGLDKVSVASATAVYVQIGDSGGLETTGYNSGISQTGSSVQSTLSTSSFQVIYSFASYADLHSGSVILTKQDATNNTWVYNSSNDSAGTVYIQSGGGVKSLSAELDRVALVSAGAFDAGAVNIAYM